MTIAIKVPQQNECTIPSSVGGVSQSQVMKLIDKSLLSHYTNLFNPTGVSGYGPYSFLFHIEGLEIGQDYCFDFIADDVYNYDGETTTEIPVEVDTEQSKTIIKNVQFASLYINYDFSYGKERMFVKGIELPSKYKPYGENVYINDSLLSGVYNNKVDYSLEPLEITDFGDLNLCSVEKNKLYTLTASESFAFSLPNIQQNEYAQVLVDLTVVGIISIDWDTDYFFNGETPEINSGSYNIIFEAIGGIWYAGAIPKGLGEIV